MLRFTLASLLNKQKLPWHEGPETKTLFPLPVCFPFSLTDLLLLFVQLATINRRDLDAANSALLEHAIALAIETRFSEGLQILGESFRIVVEDESSSLELL